MDDDKQLRPVFGTNNLLDFNLKENLPSLLNLGSARRTFNAWQSGSLVDGVGQVWIIADLLADIWRTDSATAAYFVGSIPLSDRANFGGQECVKYSAVIYRLLEIMQSPIPNKRREYLRLSESMGQQARDADAVEVIRLRHTEFIADTKSQLKAKRIQQHNIQYDELTGYSLDVRSAEFHHIRRQSIHTNLISMIWNGVVINKDTHDLITSRYISDEYDLLALCQEMEWDQSWFKPYEQNILYFEL